MVLLFRMRLFLGVCIGVGLSLFHLPWLQPYWMSVGWGVSRLPVFLMGVLAALLRLRHHNNPNMMQSDDVINFFSAWLPFTIRSSCDVQNSTQRWKRLLNGISCCHILIIVTGALLSSLVGSWVGVLVSWAVQLYGVQSLLVVIDGLTRDEGKSLLSRMCMLPFTQELGRVSMTLYLVHGPLVNWLRFVLRKNDYDEGVVWTIPIIVVVCPVVAWMLNKLVEEPLRRLLRTSLTT